MSQFVMLQDSSGRSYKVVPTRDLAYLLPGMVATLVERAASFRWSAETLRRAGAAGVSLDELSSGFYDLNKFVTSAMTPDEKYGVADALSDSGLLHLRPEVYSLILTLLAEQALGRWWSGFRVSTSIVDDFPEMNQPALALTGFEAVIARSRTSWWRRLLLRAVLLLSWR